MGKRRKVIADAELFKGMMERGDDWMARYLFLEFALKAMGFSYIWCRKSSRHDLYKLIDGMQEASGMECDQCGRSIANGALLIRADFLVFCNQMCSDLWLQSQIDQENIEEG